MNLKTNYLGLELNSPFIVGASPLGDDTDMARRLEDSGAAAIVMHSLFEEQLTGESSAMAAFTESVEASNAEALSYFPESAEYSFGPEDYLNHIALLKSRLSIPVIASLNGTTDEGWMSFARLVEQAGADALELNLFHISTNLWASGATAETRILESVAAARRSISIPGSALGRIR